MDESKVVPKISFKHAMQEIVKNSDDALEVVRELVSNSYDAGAQRIRFASHSPSNTFFSLTMVKASAELNNAAQTT